MKRLSFRELIAPISESEFFEKYWEKKPLLLKREDRAYYGDLLSTSQLDAVLTANLINHPNVQLVNANHPLEADEYTHPSGLIDVARLYKAYSEGGTIVFGNLEAHHHAVAQLCRTLEATLSSRIQANIYMTPGGDAQGFNPHYDSHDVFVLQIEGKKHWAIYDNRRELPLRGQGFDPHVDGHTEEPTQVFDLEPGDILYVPRGIMHDAHTGAEGSLHITVGVLAISWMEFILEAMAQVGVNDPSFRGGLPPGFAQPGYDITPAKEQFKKLLIQLVEKADFEPVFDHFVEDLVTSRHALLEGQLSQVKAVSSVNGETEVSARPGLLFRMESRDDKVILVCYGREISFPAHAEQAVRAALSADRIKVQDIDDSLDTAGMVVLVRRLILEGVMVQHL